MKSTGLLTVTALLAGIVVDTAAGAELRYTVRLDEPAAQHVSVTARIKGIPADTETLGCMMQQRFAFVRLPAPLLDGAIQAKAGDRALTCDERDAYHWDVSLKGAREVELTYGVPLTHRQLDSVRERDAYEYPYVAYDHALLVSPTLFVFPEQLEVERIQVAFELPNGWQVTAPWPRVSENTFAPPDKESLLNDLIAVGAWKLHEIRVGDFIATIAFAPGQEALEKVATEPMRRIITHELELFGTAPADNYLFVFGQPLQSGLAGSPKTHSMTLSVEPRLAPAAAGHLPHLVAHEFFHTWGGDRITMPDELRWVTEGFTDYYAYLVAARLELNTCDEFAATLASKMTSVTSNPLRDKLSLVDAGGDVFFKDRDAYNLVYDGGLLVAAWLDLKIRAGGNGKSLDDLMRAFVNDQRWSRNGPAPTVKDLLAVITRFTDEATATHVEEWVRRPAAPDIVSEFAKVGLTVKATQEPMKTDLRANLDGTRIVDMDHEALAYRVGLRPADRLIEVNGRAVESPGDVHRAWKAGQDGRVRVEFERDGERMSIDAPIPVIGSFAVPADAWRDRSQPKP
ncbi:MAG: hypothetical protein JXO22_18305 [Phycisphaerae bacterium]|nr:hypothetical protein [Phycisphaerae bacterium]